MTRQRGVITCSAPTDIPMPIVTLNRSFLVTGVLIALATGQPILTTVLFVVVASAALLGRKGSLIFVVGSRLFPQRNAEALARGRVEDSRMMRFNNTLAAVMLGTAQLAFLAGLPWLGWVFAMAVVAAAGVALAGYCVGCLIFTQWRIRTGIWRANRIPQN